MDVIHEDQYTTRRGYRNACMTAAATLVRLEQNVTSDDMNDLAEGKLVFHGRRVHEIASYGDWRIRYYEAETPAFGSDDQPLPAFYSADGPKGLSRGHDTLPDLLADLREWDARVLPECTCKH